MPNKIELLTEAYRRGILPDEKKAIFEEAVKRGLINIGSTTETLPDQKESVSTDSSTENDSISKHIERGARNVAMGSARPFLAVGDALNRGVDYAIGGANKILGTNIPKLGSATSAAENILDSWGLPRPKTPTQRVLADIQEGASGALSFAGPGAATQTTKTLAYKPANQFIAGGASGGSSGMVREAGGGPVLQAGAGVIGGAAGSVSIPSKRPGGFGVGSIRNRAAAKIIDEATTKPPEVKYKNGLRVPLTEKEDIINKIVSIVEENKSVTDKLKSEIPGIRFNKGASTGDPKTIALLRATQDSDSQLFARYDKLANSQAIKSKIESDIKGGADPNKILNTLREELKSIEKSVDSVVESKTPVRKTDAIGESIRESAEKAKLKEKQKYKKLFADDTIGADNIVDATPIKNNIKDVFGSVDNFFSDLSDTPIKIAGRAYEGIKADNNPMSFVLNNDITIKQLKEFNKAVTKAGRKAYSSGNFELASKLGKLNSGIKEVLNNGGEKTKPLLEAINEYREDFVPRFRWGETSKILKKDTTGAYTTRDSSVAGRYFVAGDKGIDAAKDFKRTFKRDAPIQDIKDYATTNLIDYLKSTKSGFVDDSVFNKWKTKYSNAIREYGIEKDFKDLESVLKKAGESIKRREEYNNQYLTKLLNESPEVFVEKLFTGVDRLDNADKIIKIISGDKTAKSAIRSAIGDWFESKIKTTQPQIKDDVNTYSNAQTQKFIEKNRKVLEKFYSKEEMRSFENISSALDKLSLESTAAKNVGSSTTELATNYISSVLSKYTPLQWGSRAPIAALRELANKERKEINKIVSESLYSPEKANELEKLIREMAKFKDKRKALEAWRRIIIRESFLNNNGE